MSKLTNKSLRRFLRQKMKQVPTDGQMTKLKKPFGFCFSQATFDILMDIDREFDLGAFYKKEPK